MPKKTTKAARKAITRKVTKPAKKAAVSKKPARKVKAKPAKRIVAAKKPTAAKQQIMPLKGQANLIVTYDPNHRGTAELEISEVLRQVGEKPQIGLTEVEGLFKVAVSDSRKAVAKIRALCSKNPSLFGVTHHYTPIDKWCQSDVETMQKTIKAASAGIGQNEKWKMGLNKRHWDKLEGVQLIMKLTSVVDRRNVDLDNPAKIIQVDIIGKEAGISLLAPKDRFDVEKEREK